MAHGHDYIAEISAELWVDNPDIPVTSAEQVKDYSQVDPVTNKPKTLEQINADVLSRLETVETSVFSKPYAAGKDSGMGRIVLKRNQSLQSQMVQTNTIYVVQDDLKIGGGSILLKSSDSMTVGGINYFYGEVVLATGETINVTSGIKVFAPNNTQWVDCGTSFTADSDITVRVGVTAYTTNPINYTFPGVTSVTVPANCVLQFEGGSLGGGYLTGSVLNDTIYASWFKSIDDFISTVNSVTGYNAIAFENKEYTATRSIYLQNVNGVKIYGNNAVINYTSSNAAIAVSNEFSRTAITISSIDSAGGLSFTLSNLSQPVAKGDIIVLEDTRNNSFSEFGTYRNGEIVEVKKVSGNTVYINHPLYANYSVGSLRANKVNFANVHIENLTLKGNEDADSGLFLLCCHGKVENVTVNSFLCGIKTFCCYNLSLTGNDVQSVLRTDATNRTCYGIQIGNSQQVLVKGNIITGGQHGITVGGQSNSTLGIPNRQIIIEGNSVFCQNDDVTFNYASIDNHGNCEYNQILNNYCDSMAIGGGNGVIKGNTITGNTQGNALVLHENSDLNFIISNNTINGIFCKMSNATHEAITHVADERLVIKNNFIKQLNLYIYKTYYYTDSLNLYVTDNILDKSAYHYIHANTNLYFSNNTVDNILRIQAKKAYITSNVFNLSNSKITVGYVSTNADIFDIDNIVVSNNIFNIYTNFTVIMEEDAGLRALLNVKNITFVNNNINVDSASVVKYGYIQMKTTNPVTNIVINNNNTVTNVSTQYWVLLETKATNVYMGYNFSNYEYELSASGLFSSCTITNLKMLNRILGCESLANFPTLTGFIGASVFAKDKNVPTYYGNNNKFVEADGATAGVARAGLITNRPATTDIYAGFTYVCTVDFQIGTTDYPAGVYAYDGASNWITPEGVSVSDGTLPTRA